MTWLRLIAALCYAGSVKKNRDEGVALHRTGRVKNSDVARAGAARMPLHGASLVLSMSAGSVTLNAAATIYVNLTATSGARAGGRSRRVGADGRQLEHLWRVASAEHRCGLWCVAHVGGMIGSGHDGERAGRMEPQPGPDGCGHVVQTG